MDKHENDMMFLIKELGELDAEIRVVVVRVNNHDDDIREIKEEQKWARRLIISSLFTAVLTFGTVVLGVLFGG